MSIATLPSASLRSGVAERDACPACSGDDFEFLFEKKGRRFWRCVECGLQRQWPLPSQAELAAYYQQSYQDGMYRAFADAEEMKRCTAAARMAQLPECPTTGAWLDVGCANGAFLDELRRRGVRGEGIDIAPNAVSAAVSKGLKARCATLDDLNDDERFDVITAFDVLEHVLDPLAFVERAARHLVPGGALALTVPNLNSVSRVLMGRRWYFYIPEEHMHYFTRRALGRLLVRGGLTPRRFRAAYKPMTVDYALGQFREYNPTIYRVLATVAKVAPRRLLNATVPLYIGETLSVSVKLGE